MLLSLCHPERSLYLCVILTEASESLATRKDLGQLRESEAGTGSKSPHPIPVIAPYFLGSPFLHREGGQGVRFRTSHGKHRQSVILTEASERSLPGKEFRLPTRIHTAAPRS